jgi:hypothetical protein
MNWKRVLWVVGGLVILGVGYHFYGGGSTPKGQPPLVSLNSSNMPTLKDAFNSSASSIRLLVMLSPT